MDVPSRLAGTLLATALLACPVMVRANPATEIETALSLPDSITNGVTVSRDGRLFLVLARIDGSAGPRVVEMHNGRQLPYPDADWNRWTIDADPRGAFVRVNSLRIGPEGNLWLVDVGAPGLDQTVLPGGAKLVRIDLATNAVSRIYDLEQAIEPKSFLDDVRFNGRHAYLTDAGVPGLIVLDLQTGATRRVLDGHNSVSADRPISAEGRIVRGVNGAPIVIHADQLEVSPDGQTLYFQACTGPLYRVPTRLLDDPAVSSTDLEAGVSVVADTPPTGGTAIAADGTIYLSDTDTQRILTIAPDGTTRTLVQDPRLLWVDAMWLDGSGKLWMPAAQINRLAPFQGGRSRVQFPMTVFSVQINSKPPANDHP
ncbi:SMP-30/gluconolactonase/LRE family protein [Methylorubrum extorquens]|uniref:Major royal jelly protein n=2 Tax=Methylorubrum extorquens TaxID=408 RepID=C5B690_METEA|nr:L-dopachrome tautomerase-related protein [Methylorubrum extorquens]ACS43972.1 Conserved hypothetical protein [Methylorubrum extorquens AM1]EHP95083.1 major royal jelly protein [Methylorubrum extorquens DSM 13060]MCP1546165.1 sugar lactone lactonase YvrE [Methylorubrum extorquens]MCP1590832.1 sugar lactone lactonase YvrE [Methylorubrum extorquens]